MLQYMLSLAAVLALGTSAAYGVDQLSINSVSRNGMSKADCLSRADRVLSSAGLAKFGTTEDGVWATANNGEYQVMIYCLPKSDAAVFVTNGPDSRQAEALVKRISNAWDQTK